MKTQEKRAVKLQTLYAFIEIEMSAMNFYKKQMHSILFKQLPFLHDSDCFLQYFFQNTCFEILGKPLKTMKFEKEGKTIAVN